MAERSSAGPHDALPQGVVVTADPMLMARHAHPHHEQLRRTGANSLKDGTILASSPSGVEEAEHAIDQEPRESLTQHIKPPFSNALLSAKMKHPHPRCDAVIMSVSYQSTRLAGHSSWSSPLRIQAQHCTRRPEMNVAEVETTVRSRWPGPKDTAEAAACHTVTLKRSAHARMLMIHQSAARSIAGPDLCSEA